MTVTKTVTSSVTKTVTSLVAVTVMILGPFGTRGASVMVGMVRSTIVECVSVRVGCLLANAEPGGQVTAGISRYVCD